MSCSISISYNQVKLQLSDKVDENLSYLLKESAEPFFASYTEGILLLQRIPDGDFILWHSYHRVLDKVILNFCNHKPLLILHFALQGTYQLEVDNLGILSMKEGEMNLIYLPYSISSLHLNDTPEITTLDIFISPLYLSQFTHHYPIVRAFIKRISLGNAFLLKAENIKYSSSLSIQLKQLVDCRFSKGLRMLYFDARIMDIVLELLEQISGTNNLPLKLTADEERRILQIKILLYENPHLHFTIRELARKAMINEFKLKKGFRQITGRSIFDFHFKIRMNKAKELLLDSTLSLEEIAERTGYEHVSSFISAFKELYKSTPDSFRKENKKS